MLPLVEMLTTQLCNKQVDVLLVQAVHPANLHAQQLILMFQ